MADVFHTEPRSISRDPAEIDLLWFDFSALLSEGATVASATVEAKERSTLASAAAILDQTMKAIDQTGTKVRIGIKAGAALGRYRIVCWRTLSDGQKKALAVDLNVVDIWSTN